MAYLPKSMKTWIATRVGEPKDVLELKTDWPTPASPTGANVMIKMSHAALNPLDLVIMGMRNPFKRNACPAVDFCGEIIQAGPSVPSGVRIGMIVCGTVPTMSIFSGVGILAEYVVLPANAVAEKPAGLDGGDAAGVMGVAGQTSVILMRAAALEGGERVLVNGASGGVGVILLQALRAKGVHVTGICSGKNETFVRGLGAGEV